MSERERGAEGVEDEVERVTVCACVGERVELGVSASASLAEPATMA